MWELIQSNRRKSVILFFMMGLCLVVLGFFIGGAIHPQFAFPGILIGLAIWMIMSLISYFAGGDILLSVSNASPVTHEVHPQLFNIVEEMKIAANLPAMPKIYIIPEKAPNAFATGRNPQNAAIAVTAGLLSQLNRDELQGVVAHEMSHVLNRDTQFLTFAGVLLGCITLLAQSFLRNMRFSGGNRRYSSDSGRGSGQAQALFLVIAIVLAILAPILAQLLYYAISRRREYLADATAVRLTRYPDGLANALEAISRNAAPMPAANKITAPMYIIPPLAADGEQFSGLASTHPPIEKRIAILRSLSYGVNYASYQKAAEQILGRSAPLIPPSALKDVEAVPARTATATSKTPVAPKTAERQFGDLLRTINGFIFLTCECGLKIKIPPNYLPKTVQCPRCGKTLEVAKNIRPLPLS
jgi:heat shock protein HtpX